MNIGPHIYFIGQLSLDFILAAEGNDEARITENGESKEDKPRERSHSPSDKEDSVDKEDSLDKPDTIEKGDMEDSLQEKEASPVKEGSVEREECEETEKPQEGNFYALYLFLVLKISSLICSC